MQAQKENYTLQVGASGKERLDILNKIYNPASQRFIVDAGLKPGMRVLEIGGGTGEMACWFADQVGDDGQVVMIDNSDEQLDIAKAYADKRNVQNIEFINLPVNDLEQITDRFDLVYSRWLLMHLQNPLNALALMKTCLNRSGILICEDGSKEGCFSYPHNATFDTWLKAWMHRFSFYNKDFNSGLKLYHYFQELKLRDIKTDLYQPLLTLPETKKLLPLNIQESVNAIIDSGFMTQSEVGKFIKDLENLVNSQSVVGYLRNTQIAGKI